MTTKSQEKCRRLQMEVQRKSLDCKVIGANCSFKGKHISVLRLKEKKKKSPGCSKGRSLAKTTDVIAMLGKKDEQRKMDYCQPIKRQQIEIVSEGSKLTQQRQHTIFIGSNQHGQALGTRADICVGCHSYPVLSPFFQLFQKVFGSVRRNSQNLMRFVIFSTHCSILDGVFSNNAILFFHWWRLPTYQNTSGTWAGATNVLRRS